MFQLICKNNFTDLNKKQNNNKQYLTNAFLMSTICTDALLILLP